MNQKLGVTVSGEPGTTGSLKIIAPKTLIRSASDLEIWLDNAPLQFTLQQNATHFFAFVNYTHSTHQISVQFQAGPMKKQDQGLLNNVIIAGGFILIGVIAMAIVAVESLLVPFVTAIGLAFAPKKKKQIRELRILIKGIILGCPGAHFRKILKLSGSGYGAVAYNLRVLERQGEIYSKSEGMLKCYYPKKLKTRRVKIEVVDSAMPVAVSER